MTAANEVFVSYSHADAAWLKRLQVHLTPLQRDGVISLWDDTRIKSGSRWRDEISAALGRAKAAVLLVSADFLASAFIRDNELPPLLSAAQTRGTIILPVIVGPCRFQQTTSLACFQAINSPDEPLVQMRKAKREATFVRLSSRVEQAFAVDKSTEDVKFDLLSTPRAVRQPVPIARYQTQLQRYTETYIPVRPEVCDGCTAVVEFRPFVKATLPANAGLPTVQEQFCPRCARERGIKLVVPSDMDSDTLYAVDNPSFAAHVQRILKFPVVPSLSRDPGLHEHGVMQIGAAYSRTQITLFVTRTGAPDIQIPVSMYELDKGNVRSELELIEFCKKAILAEVEGSGALPTDAS